MSFVAWKASRHATRRWRWLLCLYPCPTPTRHLSPHLARQCATPSTACPHSSLACLPCSPLLHASRPCALTTSQCLLCLQQAGSATGWATRSATTVGRRRGRDRGWGRRRGWHRVGDRVGVRVRGLNPSFGRRYRCDIDRSRTDVKVRFGREARVLIRGPLQQVVSFALVGAVARTIV